MRVSPVCVEKVHLSERTYAYTCAYAVFVIVIVRVILAIDSTRISSIRCKRELQLQ